MYAKKATAIIITMVSFFIVLYFILVVFL